MIFVSTAGNRSIKQVSNRFGKTGRPSKPWIFPTTTFNFGVFHFIPAGGQIRAAWDLAVFGSNSAEYGNLLDPEFGPYFSGGPAAADLMLASLDRSNPDYGLYQPTGGVLWNAQIRNTANVVFI